MKLNSVMIMMNFVMYSDSIQSTVEYQREHPKNAKQEDHEVDDDNALCLNVC